MIVGLDLVLFAAGASGCGPGQQDHERSAWGMGHNGAESRGAAGLRTGTAVFISAGTSSHGQGSCQVAPLVASPKQVTPWQPLPGQCQMSDLFGRYVIGGIHEE